jgi:3-oxoacyl-[acyl-carrier protein] reductase
MDLELKAERGLITGSSRGIGFAIARQLAAEGADIAVCAGM